MYGHMSKARRSQFAKISGKVSDKKDEKQTNKSK